MDKTIECFRCGNWLGKDDGETITAKHSIRHGRVIECRAYGEMWFKCSGKYCNFSGLYVASKGWVQTPTMQYGFSN